jgi:choline-sulfatase
VSLTHPHDPYATTQSLWDQYADVDIPEPKVFIKQEDQDPHSERILKCVDSWNKPITRQALLRARRAYFGNCTYVDNQVGKLLTLLKDTHLDKNTIIVFSSDHGDMLGDRGLWYKMSWFENSARVPLIVNYPSRFAPRRVKESVSTMDLLPTFLDLVGIPLEPLLPIDGASLYPALIGGRLRDEVVGEYMGEGSISPVVMIRRGKWKYVYSMVDPPQLFDLESDPLELTNLAESTDPKAANASAAFAREIEQRYNMPELHQKVVQSQRQRRLCWTALKTGRFQSWDFEPEEKGAVK